MVVCLQYLGYIYKSNVVVKASGGRDSECNSGNSVQGKKRKWRRDDWDWEEKLQGKKGKRRTKGKEKHVERLRYKGEGRSQREGKKTRGREGDKEKGYETRGGEGTRRGREKGNYGRGDVKF